MSLYIGAIWFVLSLLVSSSNDLLSKFLVNNLPILQVMEGRFICAMLTLLPFVVRDTKVLATPHLRIHCLRGGLLVAALYLWNWGITLVPMTNVTLMSFTIPIFTLILAAIFLREVVSKKLWFLTLCGFLGVILMFEPQRNQFSGVSVLFVVAAMLFALLDVLNKKLINKQENSIAMLFYSAFFATLFGFLPSISVWEPIGWSELLSMLLLGAGGNLILYCLLKAFTYSQASKLAPLRYLELIFSGAGGYIFFHELPKLHSLFGGAIIIACSLVLIRNKKL